MALPHTHPAIPGGATTAAVAADRERRDGPVVETPQLGREAAVSPAQRHAGTFLLTDMDWFQG